jgi:MOSC domain-containing protein YiiM
VGLQVSPGGVPKLPVETAHVTALGILGDKQRDRLHHGGPDRAVCLYSLERIRELNAEGHPIRPGSAGENVTLKGLDWSTVTPGKTYRLGEEVEIEITSYTTPCQNIAGSFLDGEFARILQKIHPGDSRVYARILKEGELRVGDTVTEL